MKKYTNDELLAMVEELECALEVLENRLSTSKVKKEGRKEQVLSILMTEGPISVEAISKMLTASTGSAISARNVSSQLSYLRKDGIAIGTNSLGKKFIEK
jgi:hypothetical protein